MFFFIYPENVFFIWPNNGFTQPSIGLFLTQWLGSSHFLTHFWVFEINQAFFLCIFHLFIFIALFLVLLILGYI